MCIRDSTYPTARHSGLTGQYLDIALHNTLKPGVEAQDMIPVSYTHLDVYKRQG